MDKYNRGDKVVYIITSDCGNTIGFDTGTVIKSRPYKLRGQSRIVAITKGMPTVTVRYKVCFGKRLTMWIMEEDLTPYKERPSERYEIMSLKIIGGK